MYYTKDLVKALAEALDLPVSRVRNEVLPTTLRLIQSLAEEQGLSLVNFGTFKRWDRPSRTGRNPKTGQPVHVPPTSTLRFRPSKMLLKHGNTSKTPAKPPKIGHKSSHGGPQND